MARKKFVPREPKYKVFSVHTHILTLEVLNYPDGKVKQVFECESPSGNPRRCVYWQFKDNATPIQVGDEVILTGRIENGVFLVWKLLYDPKKRKQINEEVANERTG